MMILQGGCHAMRVKRHQGIYHTPVTTKSVTGCSHPIPSLCPSSTKHVHRSKSTCKLGFGELQEEMRKRTPRTKGACSLKPGQVKGSAFLLHSVVAEINLRGESSNQLHRHKLIHVDMYFLYRCPTKKTCCRFGSIINFIATFIATR